jgi:hypothetical protein
MLSPCCVLQLFSSPRAVVCHALGATYSPLGPAVLPTYITSTLWVAELRSMEGAELAAIPCSSLVYRYVRGCRAHLRWVFSYLLTFRGF